MQEYFSEYTSKAGDILVDDQLVWNSERENVLNKWAEGVNDCGWSVKQWPRVGDIL